MRPLTPARDRVVDPGREPTLALPPVGPSLRRWADISPCGVWRYELRRIWDPGLPCAAFLLLNPSRADGQTDDATVRRLVDYARRWGYGSIVVRNLFALRATNPAQLREHPDPVGPRTPEVLARIGQEALTVCGWGAHGLLHDRAREVTTALLERGVALHCLGLTRAGQPRHPLRLAAALRPVPYTAAMAQIAISARHEGAAP